MTPISKEFDTVTVYGALTGLTVAPANDLKELLGFLVDHPLLLEETSAARDYVWEDLEAAFPNWRSVKAPDPLEFEVLTREEQVAKLDAWRDYLRGAFGSTLLVVRDLDKPWDPMIQLAHIFGNPAEN
jgi:hypothetical protein